MKTLHPMELEELMEALGEAAIQLYREYLIVGDMPECVLQFAERKDYILVRHMQDIILVGYLNEISWYMLLSCHLKTLVLRIIKRLCLFMLRFVFEDCGNRELVLFGEIINLYHKKKCRLTDC